MGLFGNEVRREFIARPDAAKGQILYKWPDLNIRKWTQLTVEQDELAVFFRDGRFEGTVQPGRATLDSSEIPFLGRLVDAPPAATRQRLEPTRPACPNFALTGIRAAAVQRNAFRPPSREHT